MLENIGNWLITIPLGDPWRAIVMIGLVFVAAGILHLLWEAGFTLAGKVNQFRIRLGEFKELSTNRKSINSPTITSK